MQWFALLFEKDYDKGPYIDTCEIKVSGRNIILIKKLRGDFPYDKVYFSNNKASIILKDKIPSQKFKKTEVPLSH